MTIWRVTEMNDRQNENKKQPLTAEIEHRTTLWETTFTGLGLHYIRFSVLNVIEINKKPQIFHIYRRIYTHISCLSTEFTNLERLCSSSFPELLPQRHLSNDWWSVEWHFFSQEEALPAHTATFVCPSNPPSKNPSRRNRPNVDVPQSAFRNLISLSKMAAMPRNSNRQWTGAGGRGENAARDQPHGEGNNKKRKSFFRACL